MGTQSEAISMAVFCDFENVALGVRDAKYEKFDIKPVLERLLLKGSIVVKKAYCDWERYKGFKATMHEANFELIEIPHVRQSGKNSADIRLVVDALDLCYTKSHVNTFVIVSGDSDFSPLVSKLRENAKQVIGVGVKQSTSDLLIANCDEFIFYDDLVRENQRKAARRDARDSHSQPKLQPDELEARRTRAIELAVETLEALTTERGDTGKIWASVLKEAIKRRKPDFSESYFGFRAFGNLLEEAQSRGLLEVARDERSNTFVQRTAAGAIAHEPAAHGDERPADVPARSEESRGSGRRGGRRGRGRGGDAASETPAAAEFPVAEHGASPAEATPATTQVEPPPEPETTAAKPKATRSRKPATKRAAPAENVADGEAATPAPAEEKPKRTRKPRASATAKPTGDAAPAEAKPDTEAKPRARRTRKTPAKSQDANDKD
ncbi:MAG: NYN domain-containing protein [Rhodocyclaceae bacterium]|nr:NYN domain-containing protein [Rhodocyclaceae bacterium]